MDNVFKATGKRKNAIAKVVLKVGNGKRLINGKTFKEYFAAETLLKLTEQPFELLNLSENYDVMVSALGGGLSGQAGAVRLAVSRALAQINEDYRKKLRKNGFLTRDSRVVERKKYGRKKARKRFQFSKR